MCKGEQLQEKTEDAITAGRTSDLEASMNDDLLEQDE
jgi:hypothetical protein